VTRSERASEIVRDVGHGGWGARERERDRKREREDLCLNKTALPFPQKMFSTRSFPKIFSEFPLIPAGVREEDGDRGFAHEEGEEDYYIYIYI
jgi:hypothetical protein